MRLGVIFENLGLILMIFSFTYILPVIVCVIFGELDKILFLYWLPALLSFFSGLTLWYIGGREITETIRDREAFATVGLCWLVMAFFGSLPYAIYGMSFSDAYFESMAGFTTTGASVINNIEVVPKSLLFWRAETQWLGGMGIILLSVLILSKIWGGGALFYRAEIAGHRIVRLRPKLKHTVIILWSIYLLFTIVETILLYLAGLSPFDAITHAFTTIATGGFSTRNGSIGAFGNGYVEFIIMVFMVLAGINFFIHYNILKLNIRQVIKDSELKFYLSILSIAVILLTLDLTIKSGLTPQNAFRYASFQAVSIMTTTGFSTANYAGWSSPAQIIILLLMFIGGCVGSTSGAIKIIRILLLLKMVNKGIKKIIRPKAVIPITVGGKAIPDSVVVEVTTFFFLYILIFVIGAVLLGFMGMDMITSISATATCIGNVGPGLGAVGPAFTYASVPIPGKILLMALMWLGRLEIYACLIILFPFSYRD
ncbi:MAG: TrkH family potassium uptake protein [Candidatus Thermoplasmatota archaeon]